MIYWIKSNFLENICIMSSIGIIYCLIINLLSIKKFDKRLNKINHNYFIDSYIKVLKESNFKLLKRINISNFAIFLILYSLVVIFSSLYIFKSFITTFFIYIFSIYFVYDIKFILLSLKKEKILKIFPLYLANLNSYLKINNDIILALKFTIAPIEIQKYINQFNYSINKGIKVYQAFEELKTAIDIDKISEILTLFEYCYLNGGNYSNLLEKYIKLLNTYNQNKQLQKEKLTGVVVTMFILICINIYVLFRNIVIDEKMRNILLNTISGRIIINVNIISYFVIYYFSSKLRR